MSTLIVTLGPPGCGKTYDVDAWMRVEPGRVRISRDGLRVAVGFGGNHDDNPRWMEDAITMAQRAAVREWLLDGLDVAIDDTCQSQPTMDNWMLIAKRCRARLVVWDYRAVPLTLCITRDRERGARGGRLVGEDAVRLVAERCAAVTIPAGADSLRLLA
jgi:predicted ABC-type ATPase